MSRTCLRCGAPLHGRIDQKFCSDDCRTDYHNEQRRLREKELREVNRILSGNWRILSENLRNGRARISVPELASQNFNFQIYTATQRRFPGRRTYWCYNCAYTVSRSGIVKCDGDIRPDSHAYSAFCFCSACQTCHHDRSLCLSERIRYVVASMV